MTDIDKTGIVTAEAIDGRSRRGDKMEALFRPRSVAIVGASPKAGSARNRIVQVLVKHGFTGQIYPVTPSHGEIEGFKAYKTVADLPEIPDVALIITPAETVPGIVEECGSMGIPAAIVFSAGFEEVDGGRDIATRLADAAHRYDMAVLGANCQGIWSIRADTMLTFGAGAYSLDTLKHAPIAIISQSGALGGAMGAYLQHSGIGCSYVVNVGNETSLDSLDALEWVIEQDDVRVVALYLEGLHGGNRLLALASRARARGVQIVALKTGRSVMGQEATASHTGKIASPYAIYLDVLEQAGILVVNGLSEAMAAVEALLVLPNPRLSGKPSGGVTVLSTSGGAGALLADHAEELEVPLARFAPDTAERLDAILPAFARKANPVDLTGQIRGTANLLEDAVAAVISDPNTEVLVIQFASSGMRDVVDYASLLKSVARDHAVPVIVSFSAAVVDPDIKSAFRDEGVLLCEDPFATMRTLGWLYRRARYDTCSLAERPGTILRQAPSEWHGLMTYLEDAGVTPAPWRLLTSTLSVEDGCAGLNWPVVVKALPTEAEHKTELGLVRLRVNSPEQVDEHAKDIRAILGKPDATILVQEMVSGGVEVILSCIRGSDFGPVLALGSGGVAIELYRDITYLALPVRPDQVMAALRRLKLWTLLSGFRGAPASDIDALVDAAVRLGDVFLQTPDLAEIEINPVIVLPQGKGLAAVDCLVVNTA